MDIRRLLGGSRARRGFTALILGTGTGNLLALALSPIITRLFDPGSFGAFTLLLAIAMVLTSLMSLRLELAVPLPADDSTSYAIVHAGVAASVGLAAVLTPLLYFGGPAIGEALTVTSVGTWLWVVPLLAMAMSTFSLFNALAIRQGRYRSMAIRNVVMVSASLGLQILAGLLGYGVGGLVVGYACGQLLGAATLLVGSGLTSTAAKAGRNLDTIGAALSRYRHVSLLLAPAGVINSLGLQIPVVLLAYYYTSDVVGWYGLTQRTLAAPVTLIGLSVAQVYLSEAARARREQTGDPRAYFWKASRALAAVGLAVALALVLLGPPVFALVFGEDWRVSGQFAQAMAIALAAQLVASPLSQTLIIFERNLLQLGWDVFRVACVTGSLIIAGRLGLDPIAAVWVLAGTLALSYAVSWELSRRTVSAPDRQLAASPQSD